MTHGTSTIMLLTLVKILSLINLINFALTLLERKFAKCGPDGFTSDKGDHKG